MVVEDLDNFKVANIKANINDLYIDLSDGFLKSLESYANVLLKEYSNKKFEKIILLEGYKYNGTLNRKYVIEYTIKPENLLISFVENHQYNMQKQLELFLGIKLVLVPH